MRTTKYTKNTTAIRHYVRVVAIVVFGISLGALLVLHAYPRLLVERAEVKADPILTPFTADIVELPREAPVRLRVPRLAIDAEFEAPLSLNGDGSILVPEGYDTVGWYLGGASPGEKGTASVLGHVDSKEGPAVFFSLGQLVPGDSIIVDRADGTVTEFIVEYFERYEQDDFPTEKVYSMTDYPSLRLITCSGIYDRESSRYSHNTVVYARLVSSPTVSR